MKQSVFRGMKMLLLAFMLFAFSCSDGEKDVALIETDGDVDSSESTEADGELEQSESGEIDEGDDAVGEAIPFWDAPESGMIDALIDSSGFWGERSHLIEEKSSWLMQIEHERAGEEPPYASALGYYGVSNNRVFGFVGAWYPLNTIHSPYGPYFEHHGQKYFSDFTATVQIAERTLLWEKEAIWKHQKAPIAMTTMQHKQSDIELDTLLFAPKSDSPNDEANTLIEVVVVRNAGEETLEDVRIRLQSGRYLQVESNDFIEQKNDYHRMRVTPVGEGWAVVDKGATEKAALLSEALSLTAGEEHIELFIYEFGMANDALFAATEAVTNAGWEALLNETLAWWSAWHESGLQIQTPDPRVNDLVSGLKESVKAQLHENGALTQMSHYTGVWIRDSFGPTRMFAKFGYHDEAAAISDYYFKAASVRGGLGNRVDADLSADAEIPEVDWKSKIPFGHERLRGEAPSYIPLMYHSIWRYTGDETRITERWDYIVSALMGQTILHDGLMLFSGDETFRPVFDANIGYPLYPVEYEWQNRDFSANSAFLFVAAAEGLREAALSANAGNEEDLQWLADTSAMVREKTEAMFWLEDEKRYSPFIPGTNADQEETPELPGDPTEPAKFVSPDINTKPIWTGYAKGDDFPKQGQNIMSSMNEIMQENGLLVNQSGNNPFPGLNFQVEDGIMTGMSQAYFLYNLAILNAFPIAETTFDTIGKYVSYSGNLPEVMVFAQPRDSLTPMYSSESTIGEVWSKFRSWEGGITAEALMQYLIGYDAHLPEGMITLSPRLVHDSPFIEAKGLRFGELTFAMRYEKTAAGVRFTADFAGDPRSHGLETCHLRLNVPSDTLPEEVSMNGESIPWASLEVATMYEGLVEIGFWVSSLEEHIEVTVINQ